MAKGPEGQLHDRLKKNLPNSVVVRLENRINLGIPDCLIALPPKYVMVELKVVKSGRKVRLSPHQIAFAMKHASLRLPTFILIEWHPKGTLKASEKRLLLYHGRQSQALAIDGLSTQALAVWPLNAVDWAVLRQLLVA